MQHEVKSAYQNFRRCAEEAPEGAYEAAKRLHTLIGDTATNLMHEVRETGFKADACDLIFAVEVALYEYVKRSNPDSPLFPTAEGFGEAMTGPARDRVLNQTASNASFFRDYFAPLRERQA